MKVTFDLPEVMVEKTKEAWSQLKKTFPATTFDDVLRSFVGAGISMSPYRGSPPVDATLEKHDAHQVPLGLGPSRELQEGETITVENEVKTCDELRIHLLIVPGNIAKDYDVSSILMAGKEQLLMSGPGRHMPAMVLAPSLCDKCKEELPVKAQDLFNFPKMKRGDKFSMTVTRRAAGKGKFNAVAFGAAWGLDPVKEPHLKIVRGA